MDINAEILQRIELFESLKESELEEIASFAEIKTYPMGTIIFTEGDEPDRLYVIKEGAVRITKHIEGAGDEMLVIMTEGDYFGEMALIDEANRSAQAKVISELTVIELSKENLHRLMAENEHLANKLLWKFSRILSQRLRELHEKLEDLFGFTRFY